MSTTGAEAEANRELVERAFEALNAGEVDAYVDLLAEDFVLYQPRWPMDTVGREANREKLETIADAFTDQWGRIEQVVADGDRVAVYATYGGRQTGPLSVGDREIAPTGRSFEVPQFAIVRVEDGKLAETWVLTDAMGIAEQLGNLPVGPAALARFVARQIRWRLGGRRRIEG